MKPHTGFESSFIAVKIPWFKKGSFTFPNTPPAPGELGARSLSLITGSGAGIQHVPLEEISGSRSSTAPSSPNLHYTNTAVSHRPGANNLPRQTISSSNALVNPAYMPNAGDEGMSEGDSRFRVNRISSSQLQSPPPVLSESSFGGEMIPEDGTLELNNAVNKLGDGGAPAEIIPNQFMQPRRSSLAQGLGGGRKKSVTLPKDFDYLSELQDQNATVYGKNFAYYTREALPRMDNYKNLASIAHASRPTLDELRSEAMYAKVKECFSFKHILCCLF